MITITVVNRAKNAQETKEFFKSLAYSHSGEVSYEVVLQEPNTHGMIDEETEEKIIFVKEPTHESKIHIILPDDCLVLGNSWERYVKHALDNGLPQYGRGKNYVPNWENYVQDKMGLQSRRPPDGVFPDLKVTLATQ